MVTLRHQKESTVESDVARDAKNLYRVLSIKLGKHGWPDRLFLIPGGKPLLIEFKRGGEYPRVLQEHRIETLHYLGYDAYAVNNYDEAMAIILGRCRERHAYLAVVWDTNETGLSATEMEEYLMLEDVVGRSAK